MPPSDFAPNPFLLMEKLNEEALERHRMNSNAFYQQDSLSRRNAAPSADHANPPYVKKDVSIGAQANPRSSQTTTLSPFINTGRDRLGMNRGSPLNQGEDVKLVPDHKEDATPTSRGIIEEYHERAAWNASDNMDERTPVYVYSPKPASDGFTDTTTVTKSTSSASNSNRPKSPKKKFLDRLNFGGSKGGPKKDVDVPGTSMPTENVAPKAAAVLGTGTPSSKSSSALTRSPSKKDPSARKPVDITVTDASGTRSAFASLKRKGQGQSWVSPSAQHRDNEPVKASNANRRVASQPGTGKIGGAADGLARSQSLLYYDPQVPPTPPTKDTPPDEKAAASAKVFDERAPRQTRSPHHRRTRTADETPSKPTIVFSADEGRTPVDGGGYAYRKAPEVHEKSVSVHSMRAEYVDGYRRAVDAANAGLGIKFDPNGLLPGGLLPPTCYSPPAFKIRQVYSPSTYEGEWGSAQTTDTLKRSNTDGGSPTTPSAAPKQTTVRNQLVRSRSFSTIRSDSNDNRIPMILQTPSHHKRYKSGHDQPGYDVPEYAQTPTHKSAVPKRVSFVPYADMYTSQVVHPYGPDDRLVSYSNPLPTELFVRPTQPSPTSSHDRVGEVSLGADRPHSASSGSTPSLSVRDTPRDNNAVRQMLNSFSKRVDLFGANKPDLSPPQQKQWEDFVSPSAMPSPLHFNPRKWEEEHEMKKALANRAETNATFRAVGAAGTVGGATASEAGSASEKRTSLRERFAAESEREAATGTENGEAEGNVTDDYNDNDNGTTRDDYNDNDNDNHNFSHSIAHTLASLRGSIDETHNLMRALIHGQMRADRDISQLKDSMVKVETKLEESTDNMDLISQQTTQMNDKLDRFGHGLATFSENYDAALGNIVEWAEGVNKIQREDSRAMHAAATVAADHFDLGEKVAALEEAHSKSSRPTDGMEMSAGLQGRIAAIEQDVRALRVRKVSVQRKTSAGAGGGTVGQAARSTDTGLWERGSGAAEPGTTGGKATVAAADGRCAKAAGDAGLLWTGKQGPAAQYLLRSD
ncbi:hypothetical protein MBLNU459_g2457t1 [Dothideomycetes sp. NU459]